MTKDPRRHHYLPQHYLSGFVEPSSKYLWVYDKHAKESFPTGPQNAAVKKDLYAERLMTGKTDHASLEKAFSEEIEGPSIAVINKARQKQKLDNDDKAQMAIYILSLIKRVPAGIKRLENATPNIADNELQKITEELDQVKGIYLPDYIQALKEESSKILQFYKKNPPKGALLPQANSPVIPLLMSMTWKLLEPPSDMHFLTCDNPVFYPSLFGLRHGEFTFPLSRNLVIWGKLGSKASDCSYATSNAEAAKELNRRTIYNASQYIYSSRSAPWILNFLNKPNIQVRARLGG